MPKATNLKCYFGCKIDVPLHRFPKWEYPHTEKFNMWKTILQPVTQERGNSYIHNCIRICCRHFEDKFKLPSRRLTKNAIPTLNISFPPQNVENDEQTSTSPAIEKEQPSIVVEKQDTPQYSGGNMQPKMHSNNKSFKRKRQYGQNYTFEPHHQGTVQDFAHFYDDSPGPSYNSGNGPNKKRPKLNPWNTGVFHNQRNTPFGGRQMSPPRPLMSMPGPPLKRRRVPPVPPPKAHKDFAPNKVTKPIQIRPKTNFDHSTKAPVQKTPADYQDELFTLRADKVPCQQLVGRLELALGSILKEMRAILCPDGHTSSVFCSKIIQREMKQCIRERIKSIMLNKYVGKCVEIMEAYRKSFPQSTDKEVLDMAIIKSGSSTKYITQNFDKMFVKKLMTMFEKLQAFSEGREMEVQSLVEARKKLTDPGKSEEEIKESAKIESEYYKSIVDSLIEARLPKALPNYAGFILHIIKREGLMDTLTKDHVTDNKPSPFDVYDIESDDDVVMEEIPNTGKETNNEIVVIEETSETVPLKESTEKIEDRTPKEVSNVENNDENSKGVDSVEEAVVKDDTKTDNESVENSTNNTEEEKPKELRTPVSPLYLVKVLCQPDLPSKAEAYKFLNQLNSVSVKKHKVIKNLLVVGFNTEKDFDNALAASGTVIENSTLIIKGNKPQQPVNTVTPDSHEEKKANEVATENTNVLTPDLENQITDLLSSIRKANEREIEQNNIKDVSTTADEGTNITLQPKAHDDDGVKIDIRDDKNNFNRDNNVETTDKLNDVEKTEAKDEENSEQNAEDKKDSNTNLYSPSNPYNEDSELDTIKETAKTGESLAETKEGEQAVAGIEPQASTEDPDKATNTNNESKSTPVRASSRLANVTPSSIRTRRASKLAQNN